MEQSSTKAQKIQSMKRHRRAHFLYNFVLYSLTSLITCLFFSYPFWLPSMTQFLSCLLNNMSIFLNAKCFFIVGNLIVLILVGESKLTQSSNESPVPDIYDEYVARCKSANLKANFIKEGEGEKPARLSLPNIEEKKHGINERKIYHRVEKKRVIRASRSMHRLQQHHHEESKRGLRVSKSEVWDKREIEKREEEDDTKGDKDLYMPGEELNKRVEAFIARVNKQRLLEAKLVDHTRG